ncbi:MAG: polysaccharide biosynthesis C-terminal domain-containing protein, partial [Bacteroidales bacterium]|nr:polysaccharide biosynthesis C-terminal domain-containing protein [Bacteroidales bacterium]
MTSTPATFATARIFSPYTQVLVLRVPTMGSFKSMIIYTPSFWCWSMTFSIRSRISSGVWLNAAREQRREMRIPIIFFITGKVNNFVYLRKVFKRDDRRCRMKIELEGHFGYRRLVVSALPGVLMMLVESIYSVVDGLFVSNFVGTTAFAALNVIWPAIMLIGAIGLMVGTGGSALVSMTMGQGDRERANSLFSMLVRFVLIASIVFSVPLYVLMEPISRVLGAEGEMLRQCVIYGRICALGLPGFMLQMAFQSLYMTAEKPQLGTIMSVVSAVINMTLDALFIVGFKWGLAGAAAATSIASMVGGFFPLWYFHSRRNGSALKLVPAAFEHRPIVKACSNGLSEYVGNI